MGAGGVVVTGIELFAGAGGAALQSFPAGYPFQGTKTAIYRQVGNAVPPPLATAVAKALTTL